MRERERERERERVCVCVCDGRVCKHVGFQLCRIMLLCRDLQNKERAASQTMTVSNLALSLHTYGTSFLLLCFGCTICIYNGCVIDGTRVTHKDGVIHCR